MQEENILKDTPDNDCSVRKSHRKGHKRRVRRKLKRVKKQNNKSLIIILIIAIVAVVGVGLTFGIILLKDSNIQDDVIPDAVSDAPYDKITYNSQWSDAESEVSEPDNNDYKLPVTGDTGK